MQSLSDQKSCLLAILTCLICQQRASQAHICPNCSKFFCFICIQTWICQKTQCPYCTQKLQEKQLINCQKLCADLSHALDSMGHPKTKVSKKCEKHELELSYFCETCQAEVCSDCCALTIQHQGHSFIKISNAKRQFQKQTNRLKLLINNAINNVEKIIDQQKYFSSIFQTNLEKDTKKFAQFVKNLKQRTDKNCHTQILTLEKMIINQKNSVKDSNKIYEQNLQLIKECPKIQFVLTKANEIRQKLKEHIESLKSSNIVLKSKVNQSNQMETQSRILPPFATKTFSIKNFWNLCQKNEMIYTQTLDTKGLQWRLKIYPTGIPDDSQPINESGISVKNINECYLSVFVELKNSIRQKGQYRHKIVIENQIVPHKIIQRDFQSQFERGECWGYDKFAKINYLYDNGLICSEDDQLKISLFISPANYFEASQDLKHYIEKKKNYLLQTSQDQM